MENKFIFELEDPVRYKDAEFIVIGRSQFISQVNRYMCQGVSSYQTEGFDFLRGTWFSEYEIKKIKE